MSFGKPVLLAGENHLHQLGNPQTFRGAWPSPKSEEMKRRDAGIYDPSYEQQLKILRSTPTSFLEPEPRTELIGVGVGSERFFDRGRGRWWLFPCCLLNCPRLVYGYLGVDRGGFRDNQKDRSRLLGWARAVKSFSRDQFLVQINPMNNHTINRSRKDQRRIVEKQSNIHY